MKLFFFMLNMSSAKVLSIYFLFSEKAFVLFLSLVHFLFSFFILISNITILCFHISKLSFKKNKPIPLVIFESFKRNIFHDVEADWYYF